MEKLKYKTNTYSYHQLKDRVLLPSFQRGFVWSKSKQTSFIDTLKRGLPIGMFLLHKKENSEKFNIIDGRQRMTTLIQFEKKAFEFYSIDDISDEQAVSFFDGSHELANIYFSVNEAGQKNYVKQYKEILFEIIFKRKLEEADYIKFELIEALIDRFPNVKNEKKYVQNHVIDYITNLVAFYDLSKITVPVIEFNGTLEEVVETFVNLNTKGTKLSKYDVFAAEWLEFEKTISDEEILSEVYNKYKEASNKGIEIEGFDSESVKRETKINIFEYAYAISKLLGKKCSKLVSISDNADDIDTLAFTILAGIFSIKNKDMRRLGETVYNSKIDLVDLKMKIIESTSKIELLLEKYLYAPTKDRTPFYVLSELQISSYIITWFKLNYSIIDNTIVKKNIDRNKSKGFDTSLDKHMLYDLLRGYWSGSGDSKLDELNETADESRYFFDVNPDNFRSVLDEWFEERKNKKSISKEVKFVLNYLFRKNYMAENKEFDLDHIIPQYKLESLKMESIDTNNPANLVYISMFDNRKKREDTYYQLVKRNQTVITLDTEELDKFMYPKNDEIRFVESKDEFTPENYDLFLKSRKNFLIKQFMKRLFNIYK
jgi:hypothetical protein